MQLVSHITGPKWAWAIHK